MVTRFLVSGTNKQLTGFHMMMCMALNAIERRGQTILYTCMAEDRDRAIEAGKAFEVTVQEMNNDQYDEKWNVVVQGEHPGWVPSSSNEKAEGSADSSRPQRKGTHE